MDNSRKKPNSGEFHHGTNWENAHTEFWESRIFGAFTIIIIGIILLLNSTGVLPWGVWLDIFKFWPLFIVSVGISIIFSGSRLLKFIGSILTFGIFIVVVGIAVFNPINIHSNIKLPFIITTNSDSKEDIYRIQSSEYEEVETKEFVIDLPIGDLKIIDSDRDDLLYFKSNYYSDYQLPLISKTFEDNLLTIDLKTKEDSGFVGIPQGPSYEMKIGEPNITADLKLKFGAGNSEIELLEQEIANLNVDLGLGNLTMDLSSQSLPKESFFIKNGLGNVTLTLPDDVGIKIFYKVGLGNISVNGQDLTKGSGSSTYTSENFSSAEESVTLNIEVGLGNIKIITK